MEKERKRKLEREMNLRLGEDHIQHDKHQLEREKSKAKELSEMKKKNMVSNVLNGIEEKLRNRVKEEKIERQLKEKAEKYALIEHERRLARELQRKKDFILAQNHNKQQLLKRVSLAGAGPTKTEDKPYDKVGNTEHTQKQL